MFYSSPMTVDPTVVQLSLLPLEEMGESVGQIEDAPFDPFSRIYQLERALDQALTYIDEMRQRVQDQALLEAQLAATEEYASVQQQAIARLRTRLKQQQEQLRTQSIAAEERDRHQREQLAAAELLVQSQQAELETLRSPSIETRSRTEPAWVNQLQQLQTALDNQHQETVRWQTEAELANTLAERLRSHLETAQQQVQDLAVALQIQEARVAELESQLQPPLLTTESNALARLRNRPLRLPSRAIATLGQDLARAQIRAEELEIELGRQVRLRTLWQQGHRELLVECDRHRAQTADLEAQLAALQDQIFRHARQSSEQETAVQHWKSRYLSLQQKISQIWQQTSEVNGYAMADEDDTIPRLLIGLRSLLDSTPTEPLFPTSTSSRPRFSNLDVPDFLLRRRHHHNRWDPGS